MWHGSCSFLDAQIKSISIFPFFFSLRQLHFAYSIANADLDVEKIKKNCWLSLCGEDGLSHFGGLSRLLERLC